MRAADKLKMIRRQLVDFEAHYSHRHKLYTIGDDMAGNIRLSRFCRDLIKEIDKNAVEEISEG